jgi:hypothetical protein
MKIRLLNHAAIQACNEERRQASMRLFRRKGYAVKKWDERAMMIDPKKTKLTIRRSRKVKNAPAWAYKKFSLPQITE